MKKTMVSALGTAALPLGLSFASGRAGAFFYAQTAGAAWLGILVSGCAFALILYLFEQHSRRQWGRWAGGIFTALQLFLGTMLLWEAAHIGMLTLPLHHAGVYAAALAALLAAAAALSGRGWVMGLGAAYGFILAVFLCLLQFAPDAGPMMRCAVQLRLGGCVPAALLLGLCHGALSASLAVWTCGSFPVLLSGTVYTLLLGLSNAVFMHRDPALLRLKAPFAALASGWGTPGFYLSALVIFIGCIAALSGIIYGSIPERKCRNSGKNRC